MLVRYDLCEQVVWPLRAYLVALNVGHNWLTVDDAKRKLVAAVMTTRPGLDIEQVKRMVDEIFEAKN